LAGEQARAAGYKRIILHTNKAMLENEELYERIG